MKNEADYSSRSAESGRAGLSANMAIALEDIGWGTADHRMRMQAAYELAQARRRHGFRSQRKR